MAKYRVIFFLVPNFSMLAFSSAIEPLRQANRMSETDTYSWSVASVDGEPVAASNGVRIQANHALDQLRADASDAARPDMVMVCSGIYMDQFKSPALLGWLRAQHRRGVAIGGICTAAWILADAGLLDGRRCSIHWENLPGFAERFPEADVHADICEVDGNIHTCAGGTAALDMMLHLIRTHLDEATITRICEQFMVDRVRQPQDRQRLPLQARLGLHHRKLLSIIELMEANISEPLSLGEISVYSDLSRRHVERLFRQFLGRSPARYYLEIRLDRARHLLLQSNISIVEVAVACGFVSASHFSTCYRQMFGRTPRAERNVAA